MKNGEMVGISKTIAIVLLFMSVTLGSAWAQGRGNQHAEGRNGGRQQPARQQGMEANREHTMNPGTHRSGNYGRPNTTNQTINPGSQRQNNGGYNPSGRTVINNNRSTTINNTTRTNVRVVNRGNYARPAYSANNPSWHYANLPRRNAVITTIPPTYRTINYGGYSYRYNHGVFYRPYNNSFRVVAPPIGIYIDVLPIGYRRILVGNYPYYYYNGTYYDYRDNNYLVVSPPVGAVVESLPPGYETVTIDGETYYMVDGAQYKPVVQENGEVWYEVIKAN